MGADTTLHVPRRRFTVDEYERMVEVGILGPDDRVELLDGEIVEMSPIGPPHASVVDRLTRLLVLALREEAIVRIQNPVRMPPRSEPEPDVVVVRARDDFYGSRHPEPADVLVHIEVSESSLAFDRGIKVPLYARSGVPEVWIVDVNSGEVIVHRMPARDHYASVNTYRRGDVVEAAWLGANALQVSDIVGP